LLPGAVNFNRLEGIYGIVLDRRQLRSKNVGAIQKASEPLHPDLMKKYDKAMDELTKMMKSEVRRRKLQGQPDEELFGKLYSRKLDEKHTLKVHMLSRT